MFVNNTYATPCYYRAESTGFSSPGAEVSHFPYTLPCNPSLSRYPCMFS